MSFRHGTQFAYRAKRCRCSECREWKRRDVREYRRRRGLRVRGLAGFAGGRSLSLCYGPLVALRDGTACAWCSEPVPVVPGGYWEVDHWLPVSKFPHLADDPVNWRLMHQHCNAAKGGSIPGTLLLAELAEWP